MSDPRPMADSVDGQRVAPSSPMPRRTPTKQPKEYKRVFKACLSCRKSKAKCQLPSSAPARAPYSGPCLKCQREGRVCVFPAFRGSRHQRKAPVQRSEQGSSETPQLSSSSCSKPFDDHDPILSPHHGRLSGDSAADLDNCDNPQYDTGYSAAGEASASIPGSVTDSNVMRTIVTSSNTALKLLFEAIEEVDEASNIDREGHPAFNEPTDGDSGSATGLGQRNASTPHTQIAAPSDCLSNGSLSLISAEVLSLWKKCRFVQQGWFSAKEAVIYIDLFFQNCAVQSPILAEEFAEPFSRHFSLFKNEPLLASTILMISSRLHVLPGIGGVFRANEVHGRLWNHVRALISNVIFGSEVSAAPKLKSAGIRTLGVIESLLLITEWPPRASYLASESDDWTFAMWPPNEDTSDVVVETDNSALYRWREQVIEPAKQSDRMCWMLLGAAVSLAHELNVFGDISSMEDRSSTAEEMRRIRIQMLLCNYVSRIAARSGHGRLIPDALYSATVNLSLPAMTDSQHQWYFFMITWIEIIRLMSTMLDMFFSSPESTKELLATKKYEEMLQEFKSLLEQWHERMINIQGLSKPYQNILMIDYQHCHLYVNALAIQAIVQRARTSVPTSRNNEGLLSFQVTPNEYALVGEVIDTACRTLKTIVSMAKSGALRFAPARIYLRAVAASIFLLKALSLGMRVRDPQGSLAVLGECIDALKNTDVDDMHISSRYGTILQFHVDRLRKTLGGKLFGQVDIQNSTTIDHAASQMQPDPTGLGFYSASYTSEHVEPSTLPDDFQAYFGMDGLDSLDDWLSYPFDPSVAPFQFDSSEVIMNGLNDVFLNSW